MPVPSNITPTSIIISVEKHTEMDICGCKEYTFYVNGQEYLEIPLDANVREPNTSKSRPYKDMLDTLCKEPDKFFENNLGISVIASNVNKESTKNGKERFKLTFSSGTGILNGGHTQKAIIDSKGNPNISKAIIKIVVRVKNYSEERIAEIAAAQNSSTAVKEYSLAEKRGLFMPIKQHLDVNKEKHIIWYEGRSVPNNNGITPDDLIALINVFNIDLYNSRYNVSSKSQPTGSASSKAKVFSKWENDTSTFVKLYPLINDIIELNEYIRINFADKTGISKLGVIQESKNNAKKQLPFSGTICEYNIPLQFLYPIIASFRANVYYDATNKKIGWFHNNFELFAKYKKPLCEKIISFYKTSYSNNINRAGKDPNLFESLYNELNIHIATNVGPVKVYDI